ncbi:MAG: thermonuclease family protein [Alphaproteobacteria bacterium]|nr:thermonuclease family protein [Alphaproteobacteria bacterium]
MFAGSPASFLFVWAGISALIGILIWNNYGSEGFLWDTDVITGTVTHVRDGDTIEVDGVPIRFEGVAAPELKERYGRESKYFMVDLVSGKEVRCELTGERSYDRYIGNCFPDGEDIGALTIAAGLARDCPRFSGGRYEELEIPA